LLTIRVLREVEKTEKKEVIISKNTREKILEMKKGLI
jgi:hypothetical protein